MRFRVAVLLGLSLLLVSAGARAQSEAEAGYFVVEMGMVEAELDAAQAEAVLVAHAEFMQGLYAAGAVFMAGPYDGGQAGIAVVKAHNSDEARAYFADDPGVLAGIMQVTAVHRWRTVYSRPDDVELSTQQFMDLSAELAAAPPPAAQDSPAADPDAAAAGWQPVPGGIVQVELPTADLAKCAEFYGAVFGWQFQPLNDYYTLFITPDPASVMGGFTTRAPLGHGAVPYIYAEDIDAMLKSIEAAGGKTFMPRQPIPGMGWFALFEDPEGNVVGLFSLTDPPAA